MFDLLTFLPTSVKLTRCAIYCFVDVVLQINFPFQVWLPETNQIDAIVKSFERDPLLRFHVSVAPYSESATLIVFDRM